MSALTAATVEGVQRSVQLKTLGNSDLKLTPLGLGSWAFGGNGWEFGLGPQNDNDSIAAVHCALDHGINWIDTAAVYGLGRSEEVLSRALKSAHNKPYIFSKCAVPSRGDGTTFNSLKADSLAKELEGSLRRLNVEAIDVYQIHWPIPEHEIEEGWEALSRFQKQGKVRWIGVSNFSVEQLKRALKIAPVTSVQPHYSLLNRTIERELLPFAQANGIGVINYSPMGTGLLSGKMTRKMIASLPQGDHRRAMSQFKPARSRNALRLVEVLREIGDAHGVMPGVIAIAWTLRQPAIVGSIVGPRTAQEMDEVAPALHLRLTDEEYDRIGSFFRSWRWHLSRIHCRFFPSL